MRWLLVALLAVTLTWQDNSDNEDGFLVHKTISGNCVDGWFEVARTGVNVATWVDELSQPGDCYRVAAFNTVGVSGFTNTAQIPVETPKQCKNPRSKHCR